MIQPMTLCRILLVLLSLLILGPAAAARAATPVDGPATASGAASTAAGQAAEQAGVSPGDIDRLVDTLQDDQKRQQLIKTLKALSVVEKGAPAPAAVPAPSDLLSRIAERLQITGADMVAAAGLVLGAPHLVDWFRAQVDDPVMRALWAEIGKDIGLILAAAAVADFIVRRVVKWLHLRATRTQPTGWPGRLALLLLAILLASLPFFAFLGAAHLAATLVEPPPSTLRVVIVLVHAFVSARLILVLCWTLLLAPRAAGWALVPVSEETANYLFIWARRFVEVGFYGFALIPAVWWLGMPGAVSAVLQKLEAVLLAVLAVLFVLQNRSAVADWLRAGTDTLPDQEAAADASVMSEAEAPVSAPLGPFAIVRHRLADIWHILALLYIVGILAVYLLKIQHGFVFVFRATMLTVVILVAVRLLGRVITRLTARGFAVSGELGQRFPTLEARANRYVPFLNLVSMVVIWAFAALGLLEAWGVGSFSWVATGDGRRLAGSSFTILVILALAFGCWELVNAAIDRYLGGVDRHGRPVARSARIRTLLPFARNAVWILLLLLVVLLVMSELGINIAPLLAGAGVVGLAIGFGSQALVKDIITGLFMLIEDTIAVGDVVDVGGGNTGVIEAISIRTLRLRDNTGSVHTIPYSTVTQVRNLTKDFAYHVIDLTVAYGSDPDRVIEILKAVAAGMKEDPAFGPFMIAEIEVFGLASFAPNTMNFQGRIKTLPMKQWAIGREFNRRLMPALAEAKIYLPGMVPGAVQVIEFGERAAAALGQLRPGEAPDPTAKGEPA